MTFTVQEVISIIVIGIVGGVLLIHWINEMYARRLAEKEYYRNRVRHFYDDDYADDVIEIRSKFSHQQKVLLERSRCVEIDKINKGCQKYGINERLHFIPYFKDIDLNNDDNQTTDE